MCLTEPAWCRSIGFGVAKLVSRFKVQILTTALWNHPCMHQYLASSQYDLHLPLGIGQYGEGPVSEEFRLLIPKLCLKIRKWIDSMMQSLQENYQVNTRYLKLQKISYFGSIDIQTSITFKVFCFIFYKI